MHFSRIPDNFSPAFGDIVYRISEVDKESVTDVEIINASNGTTLGVKRFKGVEEIEINIASYVREALDPKPFAGGESKSYFSRERSVYIQLSAGNVLSEARAYTAGIDKANELSILSKLPTKRRLARGEFDEISIPVTSGSLSAKINVSGKVNFTINLNNVYTNNGVASFVINAGHIEKTAENHGVEFKDCYSARLTIYSGITAVANLEYELLGSSPNATRLCWLNSLGGIDSHTFESTPEEFLKVSKKRLTSEQGEKCVWSSSKRILHLQSDYYADSTLDILSEVVSSPRVWIQDNGDTTPVDVLTDSIATRSASLLNLNIDIAIADKANYKNL